jgi:hypothetical protein
MSNVTEIGIRGEASQKVHKHASWIAGRKDIIQNCERADAKLAGSFNSPGEGIPARP